MASQTKPEFVNYQLLAPCKTFY